MFCVLASCFLELSISSIIFLLKIGFIPPSYRSQASDLVHFFPSRMYFYFSWRVSILVIDLFKLNSLQMSIKHQSLFLIMLVLFFCSYNSSFNLMKTNSLWDFLKNLPFPFSTKELVLSGQYNFIWRVCITSHHRCGFVSLCYSYNLACDRQGLASQYWVCVFNKYIINFSNKGYLTNSFVHRIYPPIADSCPLLYCVLLYLAILTLLGQPSFLLLSGVYVKGHLKWSWRPIITT